MTFADLLLRCIQAKMPEWDERYRAGQVLAALKVRKRWRKADVPHLVKLGIPPCAEPRLSRLITSKSLGRGVVKSPQTLDQKVAILLEGIRIWSCPETPPQVRSRFYKETRWFPEFVEAAYRGELAILKANAKHRPPEYRNLPHLCPCVLAETSVAKAAQISPALVRHHCFQVRKDYGGKVPNPPTSAAELKLHLEKGPRLLRERATQRLST